MDFQLSQSFLWFKLWCDLRDTVDLLDFMFRSVLYGTFVKCVCCHISIHSRLRGDLTCGSFQLYNWGLNL